VRSLVTALVLAGICAVALGLRLWGKDYGIPEAKARPDEELTAARAHVMLARGDLHPVDHAYPGLLKYVDAAALAAYVGYHRLTGDYDRLFDFLFDAAVLRPGLHYRIARTVTVIFGVATVLAVFFLARRGYDSRAAGLFAAVALATCYLHARDSRFATVDVPMTFFITLAMLFAVKATEDFRVRSFMLIGLFSGLAAATKYNAGLVAIGACVVVLWPREDRPGIPAMVGRLAVTGGVLVGTFALVSPYTFLEYPAVLAKVESMRQMLYAGEGPRSVWAHLRVTFPDGFGWPLFLLGLVGISRGLWRRRPVDAVMLAFAVPFFFIVAGTRWTFPRYLIPLIPIFAVFAGETARWLVDLLPSRARSAATAIAVVVLALFGVRSTIAFDRVASRKDTRVLAAEWVAGNLPKRSVVVVCRGIGAPTINEDRRRPPAFEPRLVDCSPRAVRGARYLITHEHPALVQYSNVTDELRAFLGERAREIATFDPFVPGDHEPYYFSGDAFYLPFTELDSVERGGPIVRIWELSD
jgi:4-amino-4-deoxy-L-arabinose transferase-like glycosyltransferase